MKMDSRLVGQIYRLDMKSAYKCGTMLCACEPFRGSGDYIRLNIENPGRVLGIW